MSLRRLLTSPVSFVLSATALFPAAACNDTDPLPVFVDLSYQVGCNQGSQCVLPEPPRTVMALDGEGGVSNRCDAERVDGATLITWSSRQGNDQLFRISGALFGAQGNVGTSCRVTIVEGANTYEGACSASAPTPAAPCQLTEFGLNSAGVLTGKLYCEDLPNRGNAAYQNSRDVVKAGALGSLPARPAEFVIDPCNGL